MTLELLMENLAAYSIQVLLLVAVAWGLSAIFDPRLPRARLAYWEGVLVLCLVLPWVQPRRQPGSGALLETPGATQSRVLSTTPAESRRFPLHQAAAALLVAGMAVRLAWLGIGLYRLGLYRRRAVRIAPLSPVLEEAQQAAGGSAAFYLSAEVAGPVSFGLFAGVVLLPARFNGLDPAFQRAIVLHELLHLRRRDWLMTLAEEVVRTALWFHPAVWWLLARIQLAREQTVDRMVIELTGGRDQYVETLLEMANVRGRLASISPAPLFFRQRHFVARLESIVKEVAMSKIRLAGSLAVMSAILGAASLLTVWAVPLKGEPKFSAAQAQEGTERIYVGARAQERKLLYSPEPLYPVMAEQAGIRGVVRLQVLIATDGAVKEVRVLSGHPLLTGAAVEAVKQYRYRPTLLDGAPVEVITVVQVYVGSRQPAVVPPVAEAPVLRVGGDVTRPTVLHKVEAQYTEEARDAKLEGMVVLSFEVGPDGVPRNIVVVKSLGLGLDEKAIEALRQWRFDPARRNGLPVAVHATMEVHFRLN